MSDHFISVVVPTMRTGGLDVLFSSLESQTFKDFELILVDGVFNSRRDATSGRNISFDFVHVDPFENPFPINSFCRYANSGLARARGEVIVFLTDYTWLPPNGLAVHAAFHKSARGNDGLMCPHQYAALPALSPSFSSYEKHEIDRYCDDIFSGRFGDLGWSIFSDPITPSTDVSGFPVDPIMGWADPKLKLPYGPITSTFFHGKNESVRTELVLEANGWDEDLDNAHCYQDFDLSDRMCVKYGLSWTLDPSNVAIIVNPRHVFPFPRRPRSVESNESIWKSKQAVGYPDIPNSWSLREFRDNYVSGQVRPFKSFLK